MSQQDVSKTRPYRGLVLDRPTHALASLTASTLGCIKLIFIEPGAKNQRTVLPRRVADAKTAISNPQHCWKHVPAHRGRDTVELLRHETP